MQLIWTPLCMISSESTIITIFFWTNPCLVIVLRLSFSCTKPDQPCIDFCCYWECVHACHCLPVTHQCSTLSPCLAMVQKTHKFGSMLDNLFGLYVPAIYFFAHQPIGYQSWIVLSVRTGIPINCRYGRYRVIPSVPTYGTPVLISYWTSIYRPYRIIPNGTVNLDINVNFNINWLPSRKLTDQTLSLYVVCVKEPRNVCHCWVVYLKSIYNHLWTLI